MSPNTDSQRRWPRRLYELGTDPDPRFTLANERTFLAWLRTALALMAGGVGVEALNTANNHTRSPVWTVLAAVLILSGVLCSGGAFWRWFTTERALRTGRSLPAPMLGSMLGYGLAVVGVTACALLLISGI